VDQQLLLFGRNGKKVIGIIDRDGGLINEDGFSFDEIKTLF
jgi:glutamate dehydrogenase/leucine dehydrogenase